MPALRIGVAVLLLAVSARAEQKSTADVLTRGQQISTSIAAVTSTAISPLLGVCLLGVYDYARTSPELRATLPFYSRPHFWIPISVLLLLIFFKDSVGSLIPLLKKPLDAIEVLIINKAALVLLAFPVMYHQVSKLSGIQDIAALFLPTVYASSGTLETAEHASTTFLMLVAGTIITLVVWVVSHAANVLALLSPIPYLDIVVKVARALVLLAVAGCAVLNPTLGLIASALVIATCAALFWFAVRVMILGWVLGWDFFSAKRAPAPNESVEAFTMGKIQGVPRQTLGRLTRDANGILEFRHRRMGFGPLRRIRLEDAVSYDVGRGILFPCITLNNAMQFRLLPRYRGSEEAVRSTLGMAKVQDAGLNKVMAARPSAG